jgi:ATP/maltotriose-dependent transcriptional regulator MalT
MEVPLPLSFAATKIQPPRQRRTRLARPALEAALRAALQRSRVVVLQAPAGYGKTSLLASLGGAAARARAGLGVHRRG